MFHHPPRPLTRFPSTYQPNPSSSSRNATSTIMNSSHSNNNNSINTNKLTLKYDQWESQQQQEQINVVLAIPPERNRSRASSQSSSRCTSSGQPQVNATPKTYEEILSQIAEQRTRLESLQAGTRALSSGVTTLDTAFDEEHRSMNNMIQDSNVALVGWKSTWNEYSKCEPLNALQDKPNVLAMLIQSMDWQDKRDLFDQIVASCRPREIYQLQHRITIRHGHVAGFDLLKEFPFLIAKLIMKHLSFTDLANCRQVSRNWKYAATAYDVVATAVNRLVYCGEPVSLERVDESRKNWNQLCRYNERNLRWIRGKPASVCAMLGHTNYVTSLKSRGDWVVSGGYDGKVRLWEATTGKCTKIWEVDSAVSCLELLVDPSIDGGGVVVAAFVDIGLVKVWSLHGPLNMRTLPGHQKGVRTLAINEMYLVTAGFDQAVLVWKWSTGRKVASFRAHSEVILGVHLSNHTVFSVCIDATLRVFDIQSRTLLYQSKLLDIQQGVSLQWSYLRGRMLLAATNKRVHIWKLEQLESLVSQRQSYRSSLASTASSNYYNCSSFDGHSMYLETDRRSPIPRSGTPSRSRPTSPFDINLAPPTPPRTPSNVSTSRPHSPHLHRPASALSMARGSPTKRGAIMTADDTKVKPCLAAVLDMTTDMWCANVTHHDPPILIVGSRTSPVKLMALELTKNIIDLGKDYSCNSEPLSLTPKAFSIQGMPVGSGRGVMCIDTDTDKLAVGCTGGFIHVFNMDPAKKNLAATEKSHAPAPLVVTLPHLTPTQMDSIRSTSPIRHSIAPVSPTPRLGSSRSPSPPTGKPKKPLTNITTPSTARVNTYDLPSPEPSPQKPSIPTILTAPASKGIRGTSPGRKAVTTKEPITPPSDCEEQEVLVDCEEDSTRAFHSANALLVHSPSTSPLVYPKRSSSLFHLSADSNKTAGSTDSNKTAGSTDSNKTAGSTKLITAGSTSQTFSSLAKLIPGTSSKIMTRRRASANALSDKFMNSVTTTTTTMITTMISSANKPSPQSFITSKISITNGRSRSDPNLLSSVKNNTATTITATTASSTPKDLAKSKSWSLSSAWNSPSKRSSKSRAD